MVAVEHYAGIDVLRERFGECRLANPERPVEHDDHATMLLNLENYC
jgi:hypothetical protein